MKRNLLALGGAASLAATGLLLMPSAPANAHGYVQWPPSRQAQCAEGTVSSCGGIVYEPQSVEGLKGQNNCNAGDSRWGVLNDHARGWTATPVGNSVTFKWTLTAPHRTTNFAYFIGDHKLAEFALNGEQPGHAVSHNVELQGYSGRHTVLAVWTIDDTPNAFYSCVDLDINGGGEQAEPPAAAPPDYFNLHQEASGQDHDNMREPAAQRTAPLAQVEAHGLPDLHAQEDPVIEGPPPGSEPQRKPEQPIAQAWQPWTPYAAGDKITHQGISYECWQAHTSQPDWEPQLTPALWIRQ